LPDGSTVWLNKHSKFSYPEKFIAAERVVNLEGEAFFEVKKDDTQPFIIYTPTSVTKVTGTSFNLKAYPGKEVELYVVSGTVEFASLNKPEATKIALQRDEKASLDNKTDVTSKNTSKVKDIAWKKGPKSPKKFRRFMNKIRQFFRKSEKEKQP
jgi:transmembrane sensor